MKVSTVIVAINKNEETPIFQFADYGRVGEMLRINPERTGKLREIDDPSPAGHLGASLSSQRVRVVKLLLARHREPCSECSTARPHSHLAHGCS